MSKKGTKIKIILLGESGTGKTSLLKCLTEDKFQESEKSTLSNYFKDKYVNINNKEYLLTLWDTIGQEKYRSVTNLFINNAQIVIYVYSIIDKRSFEEMNYWTSKVKEVLGGNIIQALIGNKKDLFLEEEVSGEEGKEYADKMKIKFKLTSAKCMPEDFRSFVNELVIDYDKLNVNKREEGSILNKKDKGFKINCC